MSGRGVLRIIEGGELGFWCPGCEHMHLVNSGWTFNGNYDKPTFSPSVLVTGGHRCHSFVQGGHIQFLSDCTHALAGQTVELQPP